MADKSPGENYGEGTQEAPGESGFPSQRDGAAFPGDGHYLRSELSLTRDD